MAKKIILFLVIVLFSLNCGKKGPLKLEPDQLPKAVENFKFSQVGNKIKLQWDFPPELSGNKKIELEIENIRKIHIYYSNKEILGGKFRKKSTLLRKLKPEDLSEVKELFLYQPAEKKTSQSSQTQDKKNLSFFIEIPFEIKDLDNKTHFFGVQYYYQKKKSPISKIEFIRTMIPVKPVTGLQVSRENKMIRLKWQRPREDVANNIVTNIIGYNISRKIEPDEDEEKGEESEKETAPVEKGVFKRINKNNVLLEYHEDMDTSANGNYSYYVSTVLSNRIESDPSETVAIRVKDIYPPEIPANLVTFKAQDHMFLTWKAVNDKDLSHYRIYRRSPPVKEYHLLADNITGNYYKDKNITKGNVYFYVVTAIDKKGNESEYSNWTKEQY